MAEQLYKITLSGNLDPVEGCESLTEEQVNEFLAENQVHYDEPNEAQDTVKYIVMVLNPENPQIPE